MPTPTLGAWGMQLVRGSKEGPSSQGPSQTPSAEHRWAARLLSPQALGADRNLPKMLKELAMGGDVHSVFACECV